LIEVVRRKNRRQRKITVYEEFSTVSVGASYCVAEIFFNSLLHGLDVRPILKPAFPRPKALLGLVTTFILVWVAAVLIAGIYNLSLKLGK
jgi:hypothetical protein